MHIVSIAGARPNFPKIAPIAWETARRDGVKHTIIHTGQHYDRSLSGGFFEVLSIPEPNLNLGVGSAPHGIQTGKIMIALEPELERLRPDWLITVGDVNSTAAASLVAVKLGIKTAHVEAGLRSLDRTMPEEINRMVTDAISDLLFTTEQSGTDNLLKEGHPEERIRFVGNIMIDSLVHVLPRAKEARTWKDHDLTPGEYILATLHRPSNVDTREALKGLVRALAEIGVTTPVLFPAHPRTRSSLERFGLLDRLTASSQFHLVEPLDYLHFLSLVTKAKAVLTDSGGIQEETTYLRIPCMTLRPNTERPSTVTLGTNELVTPTYAGVMEAFGRLDQGVWKHGEVPPLWDGNTAGRVVDELLKVT